MSERISVVTNTAKTVRLFVFDCARCGLIFAVTKAFDDRARKDGRSVYCPSGHSMSYPKGKSDEEKLDEARARETALRDQLEASIRDGEAQRVELARIRQRIANGVCPCCNRSFGNVRQHMESQHPDYAAPAVEPFKCSCGRKFDTFHGLRVHQGLQRTDDWALPDQSRFWSHLTVGASR